MIQVLLSGTGALKGSTLMVWVPQGRVGDVVRVRRGRYLVAAQYGTTFSPGLEGRACRCERPQEKDEDFN